ncbi:TonB-dependent receptor [Henriciella sp. AS95]|uniref:TonB-dependent receptor n=1 Tax=Henriciella sp. AS95 TaxID=3135782 RepID=UPI00317A7DB3
MPTHIRLRDTVKGSASRFELASVLLSSTAIALAVAAPQASAQQAEGDSEARLGTVTVTAQKREENLQDVPLSIQAITNEEIENLGIEQFEDLAFLSPSTSFVSSGPGTQNLFIRGVADGSNPNRPNTATATLYLDEQPLTVGGTIIDLHGYDIERYEVLNGPQGTYYGAGAVSGTVRIITNKPDPSGFEAGFDVTAGLIEEGDSIRTVEGFVNLPIAEDRAAVRLVGWYDYDGGFIDNIPFQRTWTNGAVGDNSQVAEEDYNTTEIFGGRAALTADLTPDWTGTVSAFYQSAETSGAWDHDPRRRGDLQVVRFGPDTGDREFGQIALTLEGSTPIADIVATTSYFKQNNKTSNDYSDYVEYASFNQWIQQFACDEFYYYGNVGCNDPRQTFNGDYEDSRWSTEIRATSNHDGPLQWILGAYFEQNDNETSMFWDMPGIKFEGAPAAYYLGLYGGDPLPNEWYSVYGKSDSEQQAVFGEISYQFTDKLKATLGARFFEDSFESAPGGWSTYFYSPKTGSEGSSGSTSGEGFKFNVQYRFTDDLLGYFNFAQGFRQGGSNGAVGETNPLVPQTYEPDYLDSYEIGMKTQFANGRVTLNGAIYKMLWDDFQTSIYDINIAPVVFYANAGNAEITGAEMDLRTFITDDWTFNFSANYTDSVLAEDFVSLVDANQNFAEEGTRLPYVPEWKFTSSSRYEFSLSDTLDGYVQASYAYTGDTYNLLVNDPFRPEIAPEKQDSYGLLDLRTGIDRGNYTLELFATNVTDERAELFINNGYYDERITTNRPRTIGLKLTGRFN